MANFNVNVPLDQLKDRVCECGGFIFTSIFTVKELPAIYSPSGKSDSLIQPTGFVCVNCGRIMPIVPKAKEEPTKLTLAQ